MTRRKKNTHEQSTKRGMAGSTCNHKPKGERQQNKPISTEEHIKGRKGRKEKGSGCVWGSKKEVPFMRQHRVHQPGNKSSKSQVTNGCVCACVYVCVCVTHFAHSFTPFLLLLSLRRQTHMVQHHPAGVRLRKPNAAHNLLHHCTNQSEDKRNSKREHMR